MDDKGRLVVCSASMLDVLPRADIATILGTLPAGLRRSQQRKSSALAQNVWSQNTRICSVGVGPFHLRREHESTPGDLVGWSRI